MTGDALSRFVALAAVLCAQTAWPAAAQDAVGRSETLRHGRDAQDRFGTELEFEAYRIADRRGLTDQDTDGVDVNWSVEYRPADWLVLGHTATFGEVTLTDNLLRRRFDGTTVQTAPYAIVFPADWAFLDGGVTYARTTVDSRTLSPLPSVRGGLTVETVQADGGIGALYEGGFWRSYARVGYEYLRSDFGALVERGARTVPGFVQETNQANLTLFLAAGPEHAFGFVEATLRKDVSAPVAGDDTDEVEIRIGGELEVSDRGLLAVSFTDVLDRADYRDRRLAIRLRTRF